ncbi:hypothetical protein L0244_39720, partial [bacterium]|nr:hypothetical protein [bacterium]
MDLVHVHLLLNHFPVIGMVIGLLLFIFGFLRKSNELKKVSLGTFVLLGMLAIPVYFSGEPAEKSVENLPGVSDSIIEQHEDAALIALTGVIILGIVSLVALLLFKHTPVPVWLTALTLVIAFITTALMGYTANLGGQ